MNGFIRWVCVLAIYVFSHECLAYWSCAWPHKTQIQVQENTGTNLVDYQVQINVTGAQLDAAYNWTTNGYDFRVVDSDDETLLDYWVEDWDQAAQTALVWVRISSLTSNQNKTLYLYYGNEFAAQLADVPFTFVEPSMKFHTRNVSTSPSSLNEAFSLFNASNDNDPNYGCAFISDFTEVNNASLFGANSDFIAYSETYFEVKAGEEGRWGVRYGADFGGGGGLYVNGEALEEDWNNNIWWARNWNNADVLEGTIVLEEGYHKLEVIGQEGCCDGGITVQFKRPGGVFTTYNTANIDVRSRACPVLAPTISFGAHSTSTCPPALAQYRLDDAPWSTAGDVIEENNNFPGTMLGTITPVFNEKICDSAQVSANDGDADVSAIQTGVDLDSDVGSVGSIAFWVNLNNDWNDGLERKLIDASLLTTGSSSEKYFYLEKRGDGTLRLNFEDSNDNDVELREPSGANRLANTWYFVTLTFDLLNDSFQIYVADTLVISQTIATSGSLIDLNIIQIGDKIPSPNLGGTSRSADGSFDEISIYASVISPSQIRSLMAITRSCAGPDPIAEYWLDSISWAGAGDVVDQTANFPGSMLGVVNNASSSQVCRGALVANNSSSADIDAIQTAVDVDADIGNVGTIAFWVKTELDWDSGTLRTFFDASLDNTEGGSDKYFLLQKLSDGRLDFRFEDSNDGDHILIESSAPSRMAGTWYHVAVTWDMKTDAYEIFVDGELVASANITTNGILSDLTKLNVGDNASKLYTIAPGDSANASFDEITIYDSAISQGKIRTLMTATRDCTSPTLPRYCLGSFPNAVNSSKNRDINFGLDAQVIGNPDNILSAQTINKTASSTLLTCEAADCVTGDDAIVDIRPRSFKNSYVFNDETVPNGGNLTLGASNDKYDVVTVNSTGTLNISNSVSSEFFIDKLIIGSQATVNFEEGIYWIDELDLSAQANITVVGGGPVRIYVDAVIGWGDHVVINSPGEGLQGNADELLMYFYRDVTMSPFTTFTGSMFVSSDVDLDGNGKFYGLITGEDVTIGSSSQVIYDVNAYYGLSDISWCESGTADVDEIFTTNPDDTVNCLPAELSIKILDNFGDVITDFEGIVTLSTSSGHGDWSVPASANGVVSNETVDDGSASYSMLATDYGEVTFYLKNTHVESTSVSIEVQGVTQTTAAFNFKKSGFIFSSVDTQIAGKQSTAITLQAVETDLVTGACAALLMNTQSVEMAVECLSPNNCGSATASINSINISTNIAGSVSSYDNVGLDFGNSLDSDASFNFTYDNAGSTALWAKFELLLEDGSGSGNYISGNSNSFVVVPAGFCITPSDANWTCTVPGLTANCLTFKQAGDDFNVDVSAKVYEASNNYCSAASASNFAGDVALTHTLVSPASGGDAGVLSVSSATLVAGTASVTANFSDMGVYTLSAGGNSYLGVPLPTNTSENIGRFYPKDFFIQSNSPATYSDANGSFTYTGQLENDLTGSIGYTLEPSFNFVARSVTGQTLKNYLAPLTTTPTVTALAVSNQVGSTGSALSVNAIFNAGVVTGPDASFEFTYTFDSSDHFSFTRNINSFIAPFSNDVSIQVTALTEPTDGVALGNGPVAINGSGGLIYYGRLNIQNAYGSETTNISQRWEMQYFDGTSFRLNTLDNATVYNIANIGTINVTDVGDIADPLLSTDSTASVTAGDTGFFNAGLLSVLWSPTISGHFGSYSFSVVTNAWFRYDWSGSGDTNPTGNVTFGQYRGHDKIIYWKEINY